MSVCVYGNEVLECYENNDHKNWIILLDIYWDDYFCQYWNGCYVHIIYIIEMGMK